MNVRLALNAEEVALMKTLALRLAMAEDAMRTAISALCAAHSLKGEWGLSADMTCLERRDNEAGDRDSR